MNEDAGPTAPAAPLAEARVQTHRGFHAVWLIPIVAALIAAFLGWRAISQQGETITLTFATAEGLTAGQTRIRHKAVDLGTVRRITLSPDMKHVTVQAAMRREADRFLTTNARFWVVRPRLNAGNISGLDTLLSGAYIEMDPGLPGGALRTAFVGLEEPPAVRSDEPGRSFVLAADRIGSLSSGSPVFYRDIEAGEVLGYDVHPAERAEDTVVTVHVFIRAPYDRFVHEGTYFWNVSGVTVQLGADGVRLQLESLQALLSGGIAFQTPPPPRDGPASKPGAIFQLYDDRASAQSAGILNRIPFLIYVQGSVRGLAVGAPVELFGIPIGSVTGVHLELNPTGTQSRVAVRFDVQPERIFGPDAIPDTQPIAVARRLVASGMRVQLRSANYLTGQLLVAMDYFPNEPPANVHEENGAIVLPTLPSGLESITSSLGQILQKVAALPFDDIARRLDSTLAGIDGVTGGPELKSSLRSLAATLTALQTLVQQTNAGLGPALARLPAIAQALEAASDRANRLLGSADAGYGGNSQVRRDLERLMDQVSDTARSVRLLADYLDQHPEALLRGRTGQAGSP
jgi:paraquat-inducible protein B